MKTLKLAVSGSSGKMGAAIRQLLQNDKRFSAYLELCSKPTGDFLFSYSSIDSISIETLRSVDVWIDFSRPEAIVQMLPTLNKLQTPIVSGTTGFSKPQWSKVQQLSKKSAVFWASNMSVGLWTLRQAVAQLKTAAHFDFVIDEIHHTQKKDNPSGTAITLQNDLEKAIGKKIKPINGHRIGGVFGVHTITGASQSEMIKLEHQALNRTVFAEGALKAALWIVKKKAGLYSMDDLMEK